MNSVKSFLKANWFTVVISLGAVVVLYWIYKRFFATRANGGSGISDAVGDAGGEIVGSDWGSWLFGTQSAEDLQSTGDSLDQQLSAMNNVDYAPGGRIYEQVKAQQGKAVADKNWTIVQSHLVNGKTGNVQQQLNQSGEQGSASVWSNLFGWL